VDPIAGRDQELRLAHAFVDGLGEGPRALLLEGEAGIGKTAVWRAAVAEAEASGCRVLRCVAEQAEAQLSFVGLGDLAGAVADEFLPALPAPQREALEIALVRRASGSGRAPDPTAVGVGLRSLLIAAAEAGPVVVAIDDVQWLDTETARALAFAVRRLDGHPVGVLATMRTPLAAPEPLGLERALGAERFVRARLGALDPEALRVLIASRLGSAYRRPTLLRIAEESEGNPLFALEIARELGPAPALEPGAPLPVPENLRELVAGRVAGLSPHARAALLAAAALSHPTVDLVERASSADGLFAAEESGLLCVDGDRLQFAHPLYASAVYAAAAGGRRRALHAQLAELVADPEERVRHRALAAAGPDEGVAAALEDAAVVARARGGWETAGELLEQARALTPPDRPEAARERGVRAAERHIHAGDRPRARALLEPILAEAPAGSTRADALRLLAEIRYNETGFADVAAMLEEALANTDDPALTVAIELDLSYVHCNHFGDAASADAHADSALAHATRAEDRALLAEALAVRAMVDFLIGRGVDWSVIERALALEEACRPLPLYYRPSAVAACLKLWTGRHEEARDELTALRMAAVDSGDESDLAYFLTWLAWLETESGNFAAAAGFADEAAVQATLAGSELNRAWALAQRTFIHAHRGDAAAARADAAAAAEICTRFEASNPMIWVTGALGLLELSLGNAAGAWEALAPVTEALEADGIGEPLAMLVPHALEALIALDELDRAERLLDDFERAARDLGRVAALAAGARCRGLLLAARGDLAGAHAAVERALAEYARTDMTFERARTLLVQGQLHRRRRQKRATRESLEQALALLEPMGAALWAQRARDELARLGRRRREGLTASEGRVADLAVRGLSNKEIAQALFVTVHTVEVHLSHAYAKLGVRSRTQLAGRLATVEV
jgi:DNA-binding NarL/FixJ family response regulator